jgi:hypothetical protein
MPMAARSFPFVMCGEKSGIYPSPSPENSSKCP